MAVIILAGIAYLFGSLSSAIIVCKLLNLPDPSTAGSMNPGATNVLRLGGKLPALITLAGDMLKGFLPVLLAKLVGIDSFFVGFVALCACLGHLFPLFFKFQGGKGVAITFGALLALSPLTGIAVIFCWIVVALVSHYSSLASIVAGTLAPLLILIFTHKGYFLPVLLITFMLIWRHTDNIRRLRAGTENKIRF